jgi:outer membrane protein
MTPLMPAFSGAQYLRPTCGTGAFACLRGASRVVLTLILCLTQLTFAQQAQQTSIEPIRPAAPIYKRPYEPATVPPVRLNNSDRLQTLIRAGKLYLSPHDAITLALENNIDIEVARYTPLLPEWQLERSQAGGALPGVPSAASQAGAVTNGQGVLGSQAAAGVSGGGGSSTGGNAGNASVRQIGPVAQTLDPAFSETSTFAHRTALQANATQSLTQALVDDSRNNSGTYQQGFLTGGSASLTFKDSYLKENSPTNLLNPSVAQSLSLTIQHNLLQGRGIAVNERSIVVARNNLAMSDLAFHTTVLRTVATTLNAYWALVGDYEDLQAKQDALTTAQLFTDDNQKRVDLGALAPIDLITSKSQLATSQLDLVNSQTALAQDELRLKNLISRTGTADPVLAGVSIVPTGTIAIPATDDTPSVKELVATAFASRSDLQSDQVSLRNTEISNIGTTNGLLPSVQGFAQMSNAGLAGAGHTVFGQAPDRFLVGGAGTALRQVFGRDYPTESIGAFANVPIGNRQAQGDYGIDQLQLRQSQLTVAGTRNQVEVDVTNSVVALRQARARYDAAHANLTLQQQLLDGEQKKFALGESTSYNVIQQQRDLAAAKASDLNALVTYQSARIGLDAVTGTIIESNGVTLEEAKSGHVAQ